MNINDLKYYVY